MKYKYRVYYKGEFRVLKQINDFNSLSIGQKYFVISGIWSATLLYCGHVHHPQKYTFTFGESVESWVNNFNICDYKSNIKVFYPVE